MLVGISAAGVVAGQLPSNSSRSEALLRAGTSSPRSVRPPTAQNQSSEDADCARSDSAVSKQQEGPDVDDCGKYQSDLAEHQQGTDPQQGSKCQHGDAQRRSG
jgi:hypothetical protein